MRERVQINHTNTMRTETAPLCRGTDLHTGGIRAGVPLSPGLDHLLRDLPHPCLTIARQRYAKRSNGLAQ
jgi:hypothetical protein